MRRGRTKSRESLPHTCELSGCKEHVAYVVTVLKLEPNPRLDSAWTRAFCSGHFLQAMPDASSAMTMPLSPNPMKLSR